MDVKAFLSSNPWLIALPAAAGAIYGFWAQIRAVVGILARCVVVTVKVESDTTPIVLAYLAKTGRIALASPGVYGWVNVRKRADGEWTLAAKLLHKLSIQVCFLGWVPVIYSPPSTGGGGLTASAGPKAEGENNSAFSFFRGTLSFEDVLMQAIAYYDGALKREKGGRLTRFSVTHVFGDSYGRGSAPQNSKPNGNSSTAITNWGSRSLSATDFEFNGYSLLGVDASHFGAATRSGTNSLALDDDLLSVVEDAKFWVQQKSWFLQRSVPWRLGLLLHGRPGTGKSSLVRAIAEDLELPIFVFDLASLSNAELIKEWRNALATAPCCVLLEDIDGVFHGRENVVATENECGLTFDCLLNCIDGVDGSEGVLLAVTTNDVSKIDPALGVTGRDGEPTRPGRIDRIVEIGSLSESQRTSVAARIVSDAEAERGIVSDGDGDTAAQFQLRCVNYAKNRLLGRGNHVIKFDTDRRATGAQKQSECQTAGSAISAKNTN